MTADADLLLLNANIHTLDARHASASSIAIVADRIAVVGDATQTSALRGSRTEVLDLHGATVTPGLVDSHTHPVLGLDSVAGIDLSTCTDLSSVRAVLATAVSAIPQGEWITGWGLDPNAFRSDQLSAASIEDILTGRPAYITLFDGHAAVASREALRRAGITGPREFVANARIVTDDEGSPTGLLREEAAMNLVASIVPHENTGQRLRRLGELLASMAATGLAGGHVMDLHGDTIELMTALEITNQLPMRLRFAPWCGPEDDTDQVAELIALQHRRGQLWQIAGVKLFLDGTIDGGTAWLHNPDLHGESTTPYWRDPRAYARAVHTFAAAGVPTATHAIGDAAVTYALDTLATCPGRHRIEHIETLPREQIPRFTAIGVAASMQPTHATDYTRADGTDNWSSRLGPGRAARGWPCRDIADSGAILALGSDWPVAPFDPRAVMSSAQTRRPSGNPDTTPVQPEQALTPTQALTGYTSAAAQAAGIHNSGSIAPGYLADLTVFAADPLQIPATELPNVPIDLTIVGGAVRHRPT